MEGQQAERESGSVTETILMLFQFKNKSKLEKKKSLLIATDMLSTKLRKTTTDDEKNKKPLDDDYVKIIKENPDR